MFRLPPAKPFLCLFVAAFACGWPLFGQPAVRAANSPPALPTTARLDKDFGRIPLSFEPSGDNSSFVAHGSGYLVRLNPDGALLDLGAGDIVTMKLDGAHSVQPAAMDLLPGIVNYFVGNDARRWRTDIPTYARVAYKNIYPGIDLVYYGNRRALEYDLVVAPQASVKTIRLRFEGAHLSLENNGDLKIQAPHGTIAFHQPIAYQTDGTTKHPVHARFIQLSDTEVAFSIGGYNRNQPLIIDPQIAYSTYFNGATVSAIAVDKAGSAYITGTATAVLPVTSGSFQSTFSELPPAPNTNPPTSAFVSKFSPDGSSLVYSTYVGGTNGETGSAIAVDSAGNAYITGGTRSTNFPTTPGAFQTSNHDAYGYETAFLTKVNPSGSGLVYSTYLGGSGNPTIGGLNGNVGGENGLGVAVDAIGNAFVTGFTYSLDFPVTPNAFQTTNHAVANREANIFVTKFKPDASGLMYSTYIGGSGLGEEQYRPGYIPRTPPTERLIELGVTTVGDLASGIALDSSGSAYIVGSSVSIDFPTTPGAFQSTNRTNLPSRLSPAPEPVVCKLNPTGTALSYSTYLGGSGITRDNGGTLQPFASSPPTPLIGIYYDFLTSIAVDNAGNAYLGGSSGSPDYPVTAGALQATNRELTSGGAYWTSVFTELNPLGTGLVYSTYFGGSTGPMAETSDDGLQFVDLREGVYGLALDGKGDVFLAGETFASDFPVTSGALDSTLTAGSGTNIQASNAYLAVINPSISQLVYSTYLGGRGYERTSGLASADSDAYMIGVTGSYDFPVTPHAFQTTITGTPFYSNGKIVMDTATGFVTKIGIAAPGKILTRSELSIGPAQSSSTGQASLLATVIPLTTTPAEPVLTGTVTFTNNGSLIGAPVAVGNPITTASLPTSLPASTASLGCTYSGDTYYASSDCVLLPDFALVLARPNVTIKLGGRTTTSATLISFSGFADTIAVTCGQVAHLICQFTPASTPLTANGTATLSLNLDTAPALAQNRPPARSPIQLAFLLLPVSLLASRRLRRTGYRYAVISCVLTLATLALSGCGQIIYPYGLPSGTYTIPITATARTTGVIHTAQLTLSVTP